MVRRGVRAMRRYFNIAADRAAHVIQRAGNQVINDAGFALRHGLHLLHTMCGTWTTRYTRGWLSSLPLSAPPIVVAVIVTRGTDPKHDPARDRFALGSGS